MSKRILSDEQVKLLRAVHRVGVMLKKAPLCKQMGLSLTAGQNVWNEESYLNVPSETEDQMLERVWDYLHGHE
jgi:hypothetical protein